MHGQQQEYRLVFVLEVRLFAAAGPEVLSDQIPKHVKQRWLLDVAPAKRAIARGLAHSEDVTAELSTLVALGSPGPIRNPSVETRQPWGHPMIPYVGAMKTR